MVIVSCQNGIEASTVYGISGTVLNKIGSAGLHVNVNIEACSGNHCCSGKVIIILLHILSVCL
jgi:hypothetical protein